MLDLIIYINSDGPNATYDALSKTLMSIENTIGSANYKYYFSLSARQEQAILEMMKNGVISRRQILDIKRSNSSWANEFNKFFNSCKNLTKYILTSHDDLVIKTNDFFNLSMNLIKGKEKDIGWITFTCDHYYRNLGKPWGVSVRMGFAKDRSKWPYIYECHKFNSSHEGKSQKFLHLLDMPKFGKLVKAHAPYSHLNLISSKSMKIIGPCEDWTKYTMLVDEDWGLTSLKNNLWTIWIPDVYYDHPTNFFERKGGHRFVEAAHTKFKKKWGFEHSEIKPSRGEIEELKVEYKDTLLPWSSYYNTYDWQYL
jgi:hypothetical protein